MGTGDGWCRLVLGQIVGGGQTLPLVAQAASDPAVHILLSMRPDTETGNCTDASVCVCVDVDF